MTYAQADDLGPLLPPSIRLLNALQAVNSIDDLSRLDADEAMYRASYRALPETNAPFPKFHVVEADSNLLRFAGRSEPGFEVLQVYRAGLQFHWRSDLVRALDEQVPVIGRMCALSDTDEVVVEHLVLPIIVRHRVRAVRGWFMFSRELEQGITDWDRISMFRRSTRPQSVRLPARLLRPKDKAPALHDALSTLRSRWNRPSGWKRRRPRHSDASGRPAE
ncbi:hypothetical protein [Rubellimicrobium roseum]|uniref:Uncharacterized protein n=1 Tax=Rubellimicrobium roseum TaxID=687525 RepID=A0A5C4NAQ4_9RHOB|nr:hypothetical protein [Rubellimicrobium roseum]TNC63120.1 hypothetical protein FHG71_19735 [Rubellimicrobium roseum]